MSDQGTEILREQVRSRYAQAARAVLEPGAGQAGCCEPSAASCCGTGPAALDTGDCFGAALYADGETGGLPEEAVLASLPVGSECCVTSCDLWRGNATPVDAAPGRGLPGCVHIVLIRQVVGF